MTKADLIATLSNKENLPKERAANIINMIFDGFADALKNDGRVEIRGFGSFTAREYEPYTGRNPKTGANIKVGPKKLPFFKVGKELKEMVDNGK